MVASLTVARRCAFAAFVVPATAAALSAQTLTFTRQDLASFAGARGIAAADFDRNGWADLAHANTGRNTVTILLNQGPAQSFVRAHDIPVGPGPFDLCAGDFNRDGIPDLAVANADAASASILIGRATGGFSRTDMAVAAGPRALVAADFNEDGRLDLVVTSWAANRVQVYYGNGAGTFAAGPGAGTGLRPQGLAVGS